MIWSYVIDLMRLNIIWARGGNQLGMEGQILLQWAWVQIPLLSCSCFHMSRHAHGSWTGGSGFRKCGTGTEPCGYFTVSVWKPAVSIPVSNRRFFRRFFYGFHGIEPLVSDSFGSVSRFFAVLAWNRRSGIRFWNFGTWTEPRFQKWRFRFGLNLTVPVRNRNRQLQFHG